jgi:hypothetical protein
MVSDYYKQNGYFIVREKTAFVLDAAPLFGVSVERLLVLERNETIFAQNLYMIRPLQMEDVTPLFVHKMRDVFAQAWGLDRSVPFRYVFCNRPSRNVTNVQAFLDHARTAHPNVTIGVYSDELSGDSKRTGLFFNEMVFVMGCHASGLFNMIFQQTNTVVMVIETGWSNGLLFPTLARIFRRHCFVHREFRIWHWSGRPTLNLTGLIPIADQALERAKQIQQNYFPVPNPQPWANVVLAWDFQVERTTSVEVEV